MNAQPQQRINIELGEKEAEGTYANLAMITNSPTEMIVDFARFMPGAPKAKVVSRIIMTPMNAKLFAQALGKNIKKHEEQFGEIKIHGGPDGGNKSIGFGNGVGEAGKNS